MVKLSKTVWIKLFLQHNEQLVPYVYNSEAGLSYEGRDVRMGFNFNEFVPNGKEYNGSIFFQWALNNEAKTTYSIARGNSDIFEYNFSSSTEITGFEKVEMAGSLILKSDASKSDLTWKYGESEYSAALEYVAGEDNRLAGTLKINNVDYLGEILLRDNNDGKRIIVDLRAEKHIYLIVSTTQGYSNNAIEFYWDKESNHTKSITLKTVFSDRSVLAEVKFLNQVGKFVGSYSPSSLYGDISWGQHKGEIEMLLDLSSRKLEILTSVKSSFEALSDTRAHFRIMSDNDPSGGRTFEAKVRTLV